MIDKKRSQMVTSTEWSWNTCRRNNSNTFSCVLCRGARGVYGVEGNQKSLFIAAWVFQMSSSISLGLLEVRKWHSESLQRSSRNLKRSFCVSKVLFDVIKFICFSPEDNSESTSSQQNSPNSLLASMLHLPSM